MINKTKSRILGFASEIECFIFIPTLEWWIPDNSYRISLPTLVTIKFLTVDERCLKSVDVCPFARYHRRWKKDQRAPTILWLSQIRWSRKCFGAWDETAVDAPRYSWWRMGLCAPERERECEAKIRKLSIQHFRPEPIKYGRAGALNKFKANNGRQICVHCRLLVSMPSNQ